MIESVASSQSWASFMATSIKQRESVASRQNVAIDFGFALAFVL